MKTPIHKSTTGYALTLALLSLLLLLLPRNTEAAGLPSASTFAASKIGATTADVTGRFTANGAETDIYLDLSDNGAPFERLYAATLDAAIVNLEVPISLTSLDPGHTYTYRFFVSNSVGTATSSWLQFTTRRVLPVVTTMAPTGVTDTSAIIRGSAVTEAEGAWVWFEAGATTNYNARSNPTALPSNFNGNTSQLVPDLFPGATYHYRLVGSNAHGVVYGQDVAFTTTAPVAPTVTTLSPSTVTDSSAVVRGSVTTHAEGASVWFEVGATTGGYDARSNPQPVPAFNSATVSVNLGNLIPGATYHYRVAGSNSAGIFYGQDAAFTTITRISPEPGSPNGLELGHHVVMRRAAFSFGGVTNIDRAEALMSGPALGVAQNEVFDLAMSVINYADTYQAITPQRGNFNGDREFRSLHGLRYLPSSGTLDNFALRANGFLQFTQAGIWTFTVNSDDGFRLRLGGDNAIAMEVATPRNPADSSVSVSIPGPGFYRYELLYFEGSGEAEVEFSASGPGQTIPLLVGDPAGAIRVFQYLDTPVSVAPVPACLLTGLNPGHWVEFRGTSAEEAWLFGPTNISDAEMIAAGKTLWRRQATDHGVSVINYTDGGEISGGFFNDRDVAGNLTTNFGTFQSGDDDYFEMHSSGYLFIPTAGVWNFSVTSDDGFRLRLGTSNTVVAQYENPRGMSTTTRAVNIPEPGFYPYDLIAFEQNGSSMVEFFANGPGQSSNKLVGDPSGSIQVFRDVQPPRLSVTKSSDHLDVSWSSVCSGVLEYTTALGTNATWQPAEPAGYFGGRWHSYNPMTGPARFFRLRSAPGSGDVGLYFHNFTSEFLGQVVIDGATLVTSTPGVARVEDAVLRELQLTSWNVADSRSAFLLPDLNPGRRIHSFSANWISPVYGNFPNAGVGFSFSFGPVRSLDLINVGVDQESGYGVGLTFSVKTGTNNPGYYLLHNGAILASATNNPTAEWGNFSSTRHQFQVNWSEATGLSVFRDGVVLFANVPTTGFTPAPGDSFVWAARSSTESQTFRLDNISITTSAEHP